MSYLSSKFDFSDHKDICDAYYRLGHYSALLPLGCSVEKLRMYYAKALEAEKARGTRWHPYNSLDKLSLEEIVRETSDLDSHVNYMKGGLQTPTIRTFKRCSNPACKNEGLLKSCACGLVTYCSPACQRDHWPTHKKGCTHRGIRTIKKQPS